MTYYRWVDCPRGVLAEVLPEALVVLPIGATEQHGPHLPTGTDTLIVESLAGAACEAAQRSCSRPIVLTPTVPVGASDHHFPFGATLSLRSETVIQVLVDLLRSVHAAGASRALVVNGHGGNRGPGHSATHIAATRYGMHVGYLDYWELLDGARLGVPVPGHAGAFETALVRHVRAESVGAVPPGEQPRPYPEVDSVVLHSERVWASIDGYTDQPVRGRAEDGAQWYVAAVAALAERIRALGAAL